jgi:hypothetical protein
MHGEVQIVTQTQAVCSHDTSSVAAEPFNDLDMWPMSDVLLWNWLLNDHHCGAKSLFWPGPIKNLEKPSQSKPKPKQFAAMMTPHLLLLDHSMILICDQWVLFCCETGYWMTIIAEPSLFMEPGWVKNFETPSQSKLKPKQFAAMTPHLLLLNHSMILICDQWVLFCWETGSWMTIIV